MALRKDATTGGPTGDVRNKVAVHHIHVQESGPTLYGLLGAASQTGKSADKIEGAI